MISAIIRAGFDDLIIPLIIIGSIIARIITESKQKRSKSPTSAQPSRQTPRQPSAAEDELRDFLQSLTGQTPRRPSPPPVPQAQIPAARSRPSTPIPTTPASRPLTPLPSQPIPVQPPRPAVNRNRMTLTLPPPSPTPGSKAISKPISVDTVSETATVKRSPQNAPTTGFWEHKAQPVAVPALGALLGSKDALRNAIVVREILGPPIALRDY